ncbi:MAG: proline--tRNA ligase [Candidatus Puniceispirillum sp.]|nr:proline--tRNA ligase [Candidatus Puniceispirillum sp.]
MRASQYFLPTLKEAPQEAQIISHQLMLRAGLVAQASAGIYSWLPLGNLVLNNIARIIREEQNRIGAHEVLLPTIQSADLWRESGRFDAYGAEMLRIKDRHDRDMLYTPTAEELMTDLARRFVRSYKELPQIWYQIQWKFRDEIRPRFGVMRGREFYMKDAYSFDLDEASARASYHKMMVAYLRTFARLGLTAVPVRADTGPIGGDLSHEFHIVAKTGESLLYYDKELDRLMQDPSSVDVERLMSLYAMEETMHDADNCPVKAENLNQARGIEVGHIFYFGTKYTEALNATIMDASGKSIHPHMGSYGIGVSRLVGAIIEASHDERGIIWPESVAPFKVALVNLKVGDAACDTMCADLYAQLEKAGVSVLLDDTTQSVGAKLATMDLVGLPWQVRVGPKGLAQGLLEVKNRRTGETQELSPETAVGMLTERLGA